ncbi:MAG: phosphoglycerate dehydrogenase [Candidatus Lambdaproteobacteria bacterium]|nr:phosphoglycerate dehydrogenase [Candidatus Lambdaproteobacteria bacterium]
MKIAYFFRGNAATMDLVPKDPPHVIIRAPLNNIYSEEQMRQVADVDGIYAFGSYINEQVFAAAKQLKIVQTAGAGFDKLDLAAASKRGVFCCNNGNLNSNRVADFCMMLILTQFRRYLPTNEAMKAGDWEQARIEGDQGVEVEGKTLGIIGFGNIGSRLAKRAHAHDMKVLYNDLLPNVNDEIARQTGARRVEKEELYRSSDVISINAMLNDTTRGLISARVLGMMKPSAYLIVTARGNIVDEKALRAALDGGKLAGAGIDVFASEPWEENNPLLKAKNIGLSPHIAGRGQEGVVRSFNAGLENIKSFVSTGKAPRNILNPEAQKIAAVAR